MPPCIYINKEGGAAFCNCAGYLLSRHGSTAAGLVLFCAAKMGRCSGDLLLGTRVVVGGCERGERNIDGNRGDSDAVGPFIGALGTVYIHIGNTNGDK